MKKVLLIYPHRSQQGNYCCPPTGLLYLHSMLRSKGIECDWIDGSLVEFEGITAKIDAYKPDIVGVSCLTLGRNRALEVAQYAKNKWGMFTILGGAHASLMYDQILRTFPYVDTCCIGEGEWTILGLAEEKAFAFIPGLAWREGGNVVHTTAKLDYELDDIPFPSWDTVPYQEYYSKNYGGSRVIWSRGCCWANCIFCSEGMLGRRYRVRTPENMIQELEWLFELGQTGWSWADDLWSGDLERTKDMMRLFIERGLHNRVTYFDTTTRVDYLDRELVHLLKQAHCNELRVGIESAHPEAMKLYAKGQLVGKSDEVVAWCQEVDLRLCALLIFNGLRSREFDPVTRAWASNRGITNVGSANELQVFPGTPLYRAMVAHGHIDDSFWLRDIPYGVYKGELDHLTPNDWAKYHG